MALGRCFILIIAVLLGSFWPSVGQADWWFGKQSRWEKSGLDLQQGYDQNTVVTLSGTVVSVTMGDDQGPALAVVKTESETVSLVLGPSAFWLEQGIPLTPGDPVSVRGSKAQGQDGMVYLMVQSITRPGNAGNSHNTILRNNSGRPVWSGGARPMIQRPLPMRQMRNSRNH